MAWHGAPVLTPAPSVRSQSSYWSRTDTGERSPAVVNTATSSLEWQHWEAVPYSPPSVSEGTDCRTPDGAQVPYKTG